MAKQKESEWHQVNASFYCYKTDYNNFIDYVKEAMGKFVTDVEDVSSTEYKLTLFDGSPISIFMTVDPKKVDEYTNGMARFYAQAPVENEDVKQAALAQIKLFKYYVGLTFYVNDQKDRTNCIFNSFFHLCELAGAFTLLGDMCLMDSKGRTLIAKDGSTDFEQYDPISDKGVVHLPSEEECDKQRRERVIAICEEMGIPYHKSKRVYLRESTCTPVTKEEIIHRLACVFTAAAIADTCAHTPDSAKDDVTWVRDTMEKNFGVSKFLSKYEASFVANPFEKQQYYATYCWRYECCLVLMWALGLVELGNPSEPCDAQVITQKLLHTDFDTLCKEVEMKSKQELLDKLELIYRFNWACTDARIHGKTVDGIDAEVVYEWHYALNWLTRVDEDNDWDHIQPNA